MNSLFFPSRNISMSCTNMNWGKILAKLFFFFVIYCKIAIWIVVKSNYIQRAIQPFAEISEMFRNLEWNRRVQSFSLIFSLPTTYKYTNTVKLFHELPNKTDFKNEVGRRG